MGLALVHAEQSEVGKPTNTCPQDRSQAGNVRWKVNKKERAMGNSHLSMPSKAEQGNPRIYARRADQGLGG